GINETVEFLKQELKDDDSIFVWGYRLDIYLRLRRLAPYPFSSQIFIQPDSAITGKENRQQHIYPKYQKLFFSLIDNNPPNYIVVFNRTTKSKLYSTSNNHLQSVIEREYSSVFRITKKDFLG